MQKRLKKVNGHTLDPSQGEAPRPDTITDAMMSLQDRSLAWLSSKRPKQAADLDGCRYLQPSNELKLVVPMVELGKSWKKLKRRTTL